MLNAQLPTLELSLLQDFSLDETAFSVQENTVHYDEPLIKFVDQIIKNALQHQASDIHIEPFESICRIRYRKDGLLYSIAELPIKMANRVTTRLKVMARLDIAERRLPQDGRFQLEEIDVRLSTCPTLFGEKLVLRILDNQRSALCISELGLTEEQQTIFKNAISQPQGLILVTGPTGSGKTLTLYSALNYLNTPEKNISTIEDPIEIKLFGINQVNVNPKINLQFATTLRTFLRQDPDVIMVGEIRDQETAEVAIQAAHTGHLVLSTLHTNHAIDTITRLISMGIPRYNLISATTLIIAQRLIRKLCPHCKHLDSIPLEQPLGCEHCLNGYQGRTGIYELFVLSSTIKKLLLGNADTTIILKQAEKEGFISLRNRGLQLVTAGMTSISELNRVIN